MFIFQDRTTFFSDCCLFSRAYLIPSRQRYLVPASLWRIVLMGGSPFLFAFCMCTPSRHAHLNAHPRQKALHHATGVRTPVARKEAQQSAKRTQITGGLAGTVNTDVNSTGSGPFFWREGINNTFVRARGYAQCILVCVRMDVNMALIARNFTGAPLICKVNQLQLDVLHV